MKIKLLLCATLLTAVSSMVFTQSAEAGYAGMMARIALEEGGTAAQNTAGTPAAVVPEADAVPPVGSSTPLAEVVGDSDAQRVGTAASEASVVKESSEDSEVASRGEEL